MKEKLSALKKYFYLFSRKLSHYFLLMLSTLLQIFSLSQTILHSSIPSIFYLCFDNTCMCIHGQKIREKDGRWREWLIVTFFTPHKYIQNLLCILGNLRVYRYSKKKTYGCAWEWKEAILESWFGFFGHIQA